MAISQEDMNKERHLTGDMQRAGCRTVVFYQQNKGSVWLNLLNWREPQKKNNDHNDMVLRALLWLTIPLKTIIKLTCVGPDGLMWAKNELRSSINHESRVLTSTNNGKVILDMWVEFVVGSCFHSFLLSRVSLWNALDEKNIYCNWNTIALLDDKKLNTKFKHGMNKLNYSFENSACQGYCN